MSLARVAVSCRTSSLPIGSISPLLKWKHRPAGAEWPQCWTLAGLSTLLLQAAGPAVGESSRVEM